MKILLLITMPIITFFSSYIIRKGNRERQVATKFNPNETVRLSREELSTKVVDLAEKAKTIVEQKEVYLNPNYTIEDLATHLGTNRTYLSKSINMVLNTNFCGLINELRYKEMISILQKNINIQQRDLAPMCGFGSHDSMVRTARFHSGMTYKKLINSICGQKSKSMSKS